MQSKLRSYAINFDLSYDTWSLLHQKFDLTLKPLRITVKKGYLLKLCQDLVQSFSKMFQSHLKIGLMNDISEVLVNDISDIGEAI